MDEITKIIQQLLQELQGYKFSGGTNSFPTPHGPSPKSFWIVISGFFFYQYKLRQKSLLILGP